MNGDVALLPKNSMKNRINLLENDIINLDNKYIKTLKEIFQDKKTEKITKYLSKILVYIFVVAIDIIFIIFWILKVETKKINF